MNKKFLNEMCFDFQKTTEDWANPSIVGDFTYPTWNGREVIVSQPALDRFASYMNAQSASLPSYDYAMAFVE